MFDTLILLPGRLFNAARAVSSTGFSKQTSLNSSTSFLPKNNKVHVKLGVAYQGSFCTLFRGISRAPATFMMELVVTLLNGFQCNLIFFTQKLYIKKTQIQLLNKPKNFLRTLLEYYSRYGKILVIKLLKN